MLVALAVEVSIFTEASLRVIEVELPEVSVRVAFGSTTVDETKI